MSRFMSILTGVKNRTARIAVAVVLLGTVVIPAINGIVGAAPTVVNGDLEQLTGNNPTCFNQAGWGDHGVNWALTNDAHSGTKAQSVTISNYVSGDRKLMMAESAACAPDVTPGKTYDMSVWYKSTSTKNSLTVFRHSAAGWTYWTDLKSLPAANVWTEATATTPVIPAGTDQITFGISLAGNGTLITDDYSLAQTNTDPGPAPTGELTKNPGLETGGNPPANWFLAGWGDAAVNGVVTNDAHSGNRAYSLTLSGRTQGDYKLLPAEATAPAVEPGSTYELSAWYKSTNASNNITIFAHTASGWGYWTDIQTLPAAAGWTKATAETPEIPAGIDAIAWGISLSADGTLKTDDYSTKKKGGVVTPPVTGEAAEGKWTVLDYEMPIRAMHSTLLKNGKVLLIAGSGNDTENFAAGSFKASVFDPISGTFNTLDVPKDMFCAGHVTLEDGRVLIQGGTLAYPTADASVGYTGLKDSWIFDPDTNTFTTINDANDGHWYPTLTMLGDGDIWMAGGLREDSTGSVNTERFDFDTERWLPGGEVTQSWSFWGLYPHMYLMADGRLFYSGGHVFGNNLPGTGASIYNPDTGAIADIPGLREKDSRDQSASVLLPPAQDQKVMITGGGNNGVATNLTDVVDLKQASPAYQPGPNLPGLGKMYVNATIMPDRTVMISNGGQLNRDEMANVLTASIYDPATNTMKPVAADPIGRNYHSTAVLLPDGRIVVLGSNPTDGTFEMRISVYQPPYMFRGERPEITGAPAQATYGQNFNFNVTTGDDKTIKWAQLSRPMSVTHQMDANMRLIDLPITVQNGVATVSVPSNRNILPPGPYMLTVTDNDNVPSVATWVMVR